jgi:hypothetical protein
MAALDRRLRNVFGRHDFRFPLVSFPNNHNRQEDGNMSSRSAPKDPPRTTPPSGSPAALQPRVVRTPPTGSPAALSTPQILAEISRETQELMKTQINLLKAELKSDIARELSVVKGFGAAALAGLAGLNLLLVTGVLALSRVMPAWLAGLLATAVVWAIGAAAAVYAWRVRVRKPLERTRRAVEEDVHWMKERLT